MGARLSFSLIATIAVVTFAPAGRALEPPGGYLHGARGSPDTSAKVLPAAPTVDSPLGAADRAIFKATRALKDTPRWSLATSDADSGITAMLRDFSCAAGVDLTEASAPRLTALLRKIGPDLRAAVDGPKDLYKRKRPYLNDEGEICVPKTARISPRAPTTPPATRPGAGLWVCFWPNWPPVGQAPSSPAPAPSARAAWCAGSTTPAP